MMNEKSNRSEKFQSKLFYSLTGNVVSLIITSLTTFLLPKFLSEEGYGSFQLYLFYIGYVGFFHFGWADGVFLRYGGAYYEDLDRGRFSRQFRLITALEVILGTLICVLSLTLIKDPAKSVILFLTGLSVILLLPRTFLQHLLQSTNRFKEYAILTAVEKIAFALIVVAVLVCGSRDFVIIAAADVAGKLFSLIYTVWCCRDIVTSKPEGMREGMLEAWENIRAGINLMLANISSVLIIGIVRFAIERQWDVVTFGKISLTLSVSNFLMVFIRAVAMVMFPMLRRTEENRRAEIYGVTRVCLMVPLLAMLVLYYPVRAILSAWLPQYAESLTYMALLFPVCIFESKTSMLIETYMKTMRRERWLLIINACTVGLSLIFTCITVFLLKNLTLAVFSVVVLMGIRCVVGELLIAPVVKVDVWRDILMELAMIAIFISSGWYIGGIASVIIYAAAYLVYLFLKRRDIGKLVALIKPVLKRQ